MKTGKQLWEHGNWMLKAIADKKRAQASGDYERLTTRYDISDYDIRKNGDGWRAVNMKTGEILCEGVSYDETQRALTEAFEET